MATAKRRLGVGILLGVVLLLAGAGAAGGWYLKKRSAVLTVQTEPVKRRDLTEIVTATGRIQPVLQVKISPEVAGEIIELPVKEGQAVKKGDLLVRIRPEFYEAARKSAEAGFRSSESDLATTQAELAQAEIELKRAQELFERKIVGAAEFDAARTARDVRAAQSAAAGHRIENARAALRRAEEDLMKCTIYSPIDGTISRLNSEAGERVVGTGMMAGTEIMTVADLDEMEARVEVGEVDVPLVATGQRAVLEVDSFRDRKFSGVVTQIANSAKAVTGATQEATKFEIRIRVQDKERFLPGMSVTADIETRYRTNVLTVPIQSVTTRMPGGTNPPAMKPSKETLEERQERRELTETRRRKRTAEEPQEVVFTVVDGRARSLPVRRGISDDQYYEIIEGLSEGIEVVTGSFRAIARELEADKLVRVDNTRPEGTGKVRRPGGS
ncbi:MAG: efflux RND transporter periplasmic adaptor subunit [Verrucomicrobiae bacterium]|nr:efflux RND transporter periplasmic adaptor subunit [Verrucomicrobiae bacterium]